MSMYMTFSMADVLASAAPGTVPVRPSSQAVTPSTRSKGAMLQLSERAPTVAPAPFLDTPVRPSSVAVIAPTRAAMKKDAIQAVFQDFAVTSYTHWSSIIPPS